MADIEIKDLQVVPSAPKHLRVALVPGPDELNPTTDSSIVLSEEQTLGTAASRDAGAASDALPDNTLVDSKISTAITNLNLGTASGKNVASDAEVLAGTADKLPDSKQIKQLYKPVAVGRAAMKAVASGMTNGQIIFLSEGGRSGDFEYVEGNFSAEVAADPLEGVYVAIDGVDTTTAALRRILNGFVTPEMFGAVGDGVTNDREPCQYAMLSITWNGCTLVFTDGLDYNIVNASGVGATLVEQRADAVLNSTLYALASSQSGIHIIINGTITGTSPLDDILRFTGDRVTISGSGTVRNSSGVFLDTNSSDPTLQWRPSNIKIDGDGCSVAGLSIVDQVAVGIHDNGNDNTISFCEFSGGPSSHGPGTVQFGVLQTSGGLIRYRGKVTNCVFKRSQSGGACYSGVFSVCKDANISLNSFDSLIEHGVYANATGCIIHGNHFRNIDYAGAIQSFNGGTITDNRFEDCGFGQIAVARPSNTVISKNVAVNAGLSGISVRTGTGDTPDTVYTNLTISDNIIDFVGDQSAIDIALNCGIRGISVLNNKIDCSLGSSTYGPVRIDVTPSSSVQGSNLDVSGNTVNGSETYGVYVRGFNVGKVFNNITKDTNRAGAAGMPFRLFSCSDIEFYNNTAIGSLNVSSVLFAGSADGNSQILAYNNNGIDLSGSSGALCSVPAGELSHGNGRDSNGVKGVFTPANAASGTVNTGAAKSARPPAYIVIAPANATAGVIQAGAQRVSVSSVADGSFTWVTASGSPIGTTGATYFYEVIQ